MKIVSQRFFLIFKQKYDLIFNRFKAEDQLKLVEEQRKLLEERQKFEDERRKKEKDEQKLILGKQGTRAKLSFNVGSRL